MPAKARGGDRACGALADAGVARGKGRLLTEPGIIHVVDVTDPVVFFVTNCRHAVATRIEVRADKFGTLSIHATEEAILKELHEHE